MQSPGRGTSLGDSQRLAATATWISLSLYLLVDENKSNYIDHDRLEILKGPWT